MKPTKSENLNCVADRISVIIPCHNGASFLAEAIDSVLAQSVTADEIIVVDDGSTDETQAIALRYPQVQYLYQDQQGVSVARNVGLQLSQGDYILFLDHDDRLLPNAIASGLKAFQARPESGFVFGVCQNIDRSGRVIQLPHRAVLERPYPEPIYANILQGNSIHPPARHLFHRSVFDRVGGFDASLVVAEDYDLYLRVAAAFPGYCHGEKVVEYREHEASASTSAWSSQHLLASLKVLAKQRSFVDRHSEYQTAYRQGNQHWIRIYAPYIAYDIAKYLKRRNPARAIQVLGLLLRYYPQGIWRYGLELFSKRFRSHL